MQGQIKNEFNSIEQMISTVNGLQMDKDEAAALVADIARKNKELLEQKPNEADQILAHINPGYSSALIIACIKAILDVGIAKKLDQNVDRATDLFTTFLQSETCVKKHIRHIPDLYLPLARECVFHCLVKRADPFFAYDLGKAAIEAFMKEGENCLTSLHSATLAAVIKIGDFDEAKKYVYTPILDVISELNPAQEVVDITSKRSRCSAPAYFDSKYMLSYFFYCGLVVGKLGDYKKSLQFMDMCIGIPGQIASQVQMDALKKYYVLSLIVTGGVSVPSNRSPSLMRVLKAKGRLDAYTALAEAVTENNDKSKAVLEVLETKKTHFEQDNNWGLCQILIETLRKNAVLNIAKTYSSIRLSDLAHRSHCPEEEIVPFLKDLEEQGELRAEIDLEKGIVKFAITHKPVAHDMLMRKIEYLQNVRKEVDRLEVAAQKNPSHIIRTLRGIAGQIAMMDDEGLSESACPMDA